MGKGSKKKRKQKKADFQKVKLKVGKKIPKGNVLDTTFKTRKIAIREQLKECSPNVSGAKSGTKRDLQEILKHTGNFHPSVRINGLNDLRETLIAHPDSSAAHLSVIVGRVASLCVDGDSMVRKAAIGLLRYVLSSVPTASLVPHLHVVVAHVRCALSHISQDIRSSALQVVDLLVDERFGASAEVARFSGRLLMDFTDQLSEKTGQVQKMYATHASRQPCVKRSLSSDPSANMTSVAWHLQVSRRLRAILRNILRMQVSDAPGSQSEPIVVKYDSKVPLYVPLMYKVSRFDASDFVRRFDLAELFENACQMEVHLASLISLLFEMWVEAHSLNRSDALNLISREPLETYLCIVDVMQLLWKLLDLRSKNEHKSLEYWFSEDFEKKFLSYCMAGFPYADHSAPVRKKGKKEVKEATSAQDAVALNLSLCYITTCLNSFGNDPKLSLASVWDYMMKFIEGDGWIIAHADTALHVLRKFLKCKSERSRFLLSAIHKLCWRLSVHRTERKQLFILLGELVTLPEYAHHCGEPYLWAWIASLPKHIVEYDGEAPHEMFNIIRCVCYRGNAEFLASVQAHLSSIFDCFLRHSPMNSNSESDFKVAADLLYWVPSFDKDLFDKVAEVCKNDHVSTGLRSYLVDVIDNRIQRQSSGYGKAWYRRSEYLSFLSKID